jgi:hypothetical protein
MRPGFIPAGPGFSWIEVVSKPSIGFMVPSTPSRLRRTGKAGATFEPEEYSSISRIARGLHFVLNFAPNEVNRPKLQRRLKIGPEGRF